MIHIYYGYGKGKTTSAIGAGMRGAGAGRKVMLVQFLKDNKSSELSVLPFDVYNAPNELSFNPDEEYKPWVDGAIEYIKRSNADFIILDEFLDTVGSFVSVDDALNLLCDSEKEYIITGHKKIDELFNIADYITHFEKERHPFDKGVKARRGIEF